VQPPSDDMRPMSPKDFKRMLENEAAASMFSWLRSRGVAASGDQQVAPSGSNLMGLRSLGSSPLGKPWQPCHSEGCHHVTSNNRIQHLPLVMNEQEVLLKQLT
jgi:hypothetical protein